ncbi:MAG TPA: D-alanine--D-alanine ligase [Bacillota bacterium]|nr:D-alanine--D-alanine ligase [Bacillota bacterium]
MSKLRVAVIFGGQSAEHEVSLQSAKNILSALSKDKYEPVLISIDKTGRWFLNEDSTMFLNEDNPKLIALDESKGQVAIVPGQGEPQMMDLSSKESLGRIDVVFPVLHGPFGEDGTVQGLLKLANLPFVGASVLGSAVGMDKDVMKRLMQADGIPVADFVVMTYADKDKTSFDMVEEALGMPVFIKPSNMGSSVGISKVTNEQDFYKAIEDAFLYDTKIIIEEFIDGREIECSVLGNEGPIASIPGEILPQEGFYSYEAKYIDEKGAILEVPAKLAPKMCKAIQDYAIAAYRSLCCQGMARVDMFLKDNGQVVVNEINTLPGFTKISMYPKLWEESGLPYEDLIDRLIDLALERFDRESALKTNVDL